MAENSKTLLAMEQYYDNAFKAVEAKGFEKYLLEAKQELNIAEAPGQQGFE